MTKREQVLATMLAALETVPGATVRRNEPLPMSVPAGGLIMLRDGDPGEPDVTLNPRTEYYSHAVEIEAMLTVPVVGGAEADLDVLTAAIATALAADRTLGGLAEHLRLGTPQVSTLPIEGAPPLIGAAMIATVEYQIADPLE